ncbi:MAG: DHH family phosphoesterase [Candidatus Nitrosoabyssus spongiisocia]|nr:MAG: DHH family phosphoesterase [Nitrosopumilaceae archaeon AB1(1)]
MDLNEGFSDSSILVAKKSSKAKLVKTRIACLSHKEDADGISSASLIKQSFNADITLVDYPGQIAALEEIASDKKLKMLFICDFGLSKTNQDKFVEILTALRKRLVKIAYIDHHDIDPKIAKKIKKIGVQLVHNINECATVLVYDTFRKKLDKHASFVAACAAITDYMDDRPLGSKLLAMYDRQFVLINATSLTFNIVGHQKKEEFLLDLVNDLSKSKYPHDIDGFFDFAQSQASTLADVMNKVTRSMKVLKNLGYVEVKDSGVSGAVNFVLGFSGRDVGIAYKNRVDHNIYSVSIRGSKNCKTHLGRLTNKLATSLGGSGGGHDKACGAIIPHSKIKKFIMEFNKSLS